MTAGEPGLCVNCGVFTNLYDDKYCVDCYNEAVEQANTYDYEENAGVSIENQHIDDICYERKNNGAALDRIIPYEYKSSPEKCAICQDMMNCGETVVTLPCAHTFHGNCIYHWLRNNDDCPICRSVINTQ